MNYPQLPLPLYVIIHKVKKNSGKFCRGDVMFIHTVINRLLITVWIAI
jgi:hypothetical protein